MKQALPKNTPPLKSSASALDKNQKRDSERPLVEDIRLLGRILGDVIRVQEGPEAYELVEQIRKLSVAFRRDADHEADKALKKLLKSLPGDRAVSVIRAFTYFSHLANLAEDRHHIRRRAVRHLEKGRVCIFAAGTGNPYFTTDTAGSLRAIEMKADVILKGTRVDGVYSADPEKDPTATKFETIGFQDCISKNLKVMDMTAFTLCMENKLPIIVFDTNKPGNLLKVVEGMQVGTLVG